MLDMYATGTFAIDATDPRNQFHERALHEARIATEYRNYAAAEPRASGFLERLRAAVAGVQVDNDARALHLPRLAPIQRGPNRALVSFPLDEHDRSHDRDRHRDPNRRRPRPRAQRDPAARP